MRAYYFGNLYMSSIQQGIQSLHTTAEMFCKYDCDPSGETGNADRLVQVFEWAKNHKTVILKQAGYSSDLKVISALFADHTNPYPWAYFCEEGVDDALTCVGIILPPSIYDTADELRNMPYSRRVKFLAASGLNEFSMKVVDVIMETSLAR